MGTAMLFTISSPKFILLLHIFIKDIFLKRKYILQHRHLKI